jgi:hypothetical protein
MILAKPCQNLLNQPCSNSFSSKAPPLCLCHPLHRLHCPIPSPNPLHDQDHHRPTWAWAFFKTRSFFRATSPLTSPNHPQDFPCTVAPCIFPIGGNRPRFGGRLHVEHLAGVQSTTSPRAYSPSPRVPSRPRPRLPLTRPMAQYRCLPLSSPSWPVSPPTTTSPWTPRRADLSPARYKPPGAPLSLTPTPIPSHTNPHSEHQLLLALS